jgi:hypothetical protein
MKKSVVILLIGLSLVAARAWAKEGGDQYPNGAENWFAGAAPPPGHYYVNYFGYYTGTLKNGFGRGAVANGMTPSMDATFNAFRFVDMTHIRLLGGDYGTHVIVPVVYQSMDLDGRASNASVGDVIVNPLILGWHRAPWHTIAAVDIYLPTGFYDQSDARVSIGANYYGFDPLFAFSYMPNSGWEGSAKVMYNLKTTNPATKYHSGQECHVDYAVGKHIGGWMIGVTGYALKQTTDDTVNGQIVPASPGMWSAGRRGQVIAIGPSAGYHSRHNVTLMAQWQEETLVRNRFGGDKFWIKMIIPVNFRSILRYSE